MSDIENGEWEEVFEDFVDDVGTVQCAYQYIEPEDEDNSPGDVDMFVFDEHGKDITYDIPDKDYRRLLKEARQRCFEGYDHTRYLLDRARRFANGY